MHHPQAYLEEISDLFQDLTREEQLLTFRDYGDHLESLDKARKTEENLVPGCASATYIVCSLHDDGTVQFQGDSESLISRGYLYILINAFNGCTPDQIVKEAEPYIQAFAEKTQIKLSMVASRANAFDNIFRFMQRKAIGALVNTHAGSSN